MMVPASVMAHADEINDYLKINELNDVRIEITAKGVVVQRIESIHVRRF